MNAGALLGRVTALLRSRPVRWGFALVAGSLAVWAVAERFDEIVDAVRRMRPGYLPAAAAATLANLLLTGMAWRALLADLGSRLPLRAAARVFFVGQIGKYVPGSVWPVVVQAEMAHDHGVPRRRSATASLVLILLSAVSALTVVLAGLPFVPVAEDGFGWTVFLLPPLLVLLLPGVLGGLADRALRMLGRDPLDRRTTWRGTLAAFCWALLSWLSSGLQVWFLVVALGGEATARTLALAVCGYALAWAVGLMVVVAPAGAGAREVALAALLGGAVDAGGVVVVVLLSRVLFTVADLAMAGAGLAVGHGDAGRGRARSDGTGPAGPEQHPGPAPLSPGS